MFFIVGVNTERKDIEYDNTAICKGCGRHTRYEVFITNMCLRLFFIPVFKWRKKYYVESRCCNKVYELKSEVGKRIQYGDYVFITDDDLIDVGNEGFAYKHRESFKSCRSCGFDTYENFNYCPNCGERFMM